MLFPDLFYFETSGRFLFSVHAPASSAGIQDPILVTYTTSWFGCPDSSLSLDMSYGRAALALCSSSLLWCWFLSLRAVPFQFLSQNHSTPYLLSMFPLLLTLHDFVMSKTNSRNNNNHKNKSRHLGLTVCHQGNFLFALYHPGLCWDVYCEPYFFDRGS